MYAMNYSVYLETTIISYLAARPSNNVIALAQQEVTYEWWTLERKHYDCYVSEFVWNEASQGDSGAAEKRLSLLQGIPYLPVNDVVADLASEIVSVCGIPQRAVADAFHIAIAAVHGIDFLLTWNCTHIANAVMQKRLQRLSEKRSVAIPILCTPYELIGGNNVER